jgi:peptidoglycan/xylan/chitin deacetylase (PgdA/CDA1 family)
MYHRISDTNEQSPYWERRTATAPRLFAEHLRYLSGEGYSTISLNGAAEHLREGEAEVRKLVALTFDDGYADFYTSAFPVLLQYGFTATVFLPTAFIGDTSRDFKGALCLTWGQVRELRNLGIDFGSHTHTHRRLERLTATEIESELSESKAAIEQALGESVTSFAYPYAFPEQRRDLVGVVRQTLLRAGYTTGVTTIIGVASPKDDRLFMRRVPIKSGDDLPFFKAKIEGGYDWLHALQYRYKQARELTQRWPRTVTGDRRIATALNRFAQPPGKTAPTLPPGTGRWSDPDLGA